MKSSSTRSIGSMPPAAQAAGGRGRNCRLLTRRTFLGWSSVAMLGSGSAPAMLAQTAGKPSSEEERILALIEANRPSRLAKLPADFNGRVGAAHVAGKYHLTAKPFLVEGAEKLLELGTRLGKFWFEPDRVNGSYPFNSQWSRYNSFLQLAASEYFQKLFALPFATLILEAHSPVEHQWRQAGLTGAFYEAVTREFHDLTAHLYKAYGDRKVTFVLQHWEGDWLLRGAGERWNPPPQDWRERCERMQRWLKARQAGVATARESFGRGSKCVVAHAAEVNRVADDWQDIPSMTRHVLPEVELDLVSYSAYDGLVGKPIRLWKCLAEIRQHARTGPLFGKEAIYVGEMGIPENEQPQRIAERLNEWMGVFLAAKVKYVAHWELYCNEFAGSVGQKPKTPVADPKLVRGFWLVRPDGSLSESGKYFSGLWKRTA